MNTCQIQTKNKLISNLQQPLLKQGNSQTVFLAKNQRDLLIQKGDSRQSYSIAKSMANKINEHIIDRYEINKNVATVEQYNNGVYITFNPSVQLIDTIIKEEEERRQIIDVTNKINNDKLLYGDENSFPLDGEGEFFEPAVKEFKTFIDYKQTMINLLDKQLFNLKSSLKLLKYGTPEYKEQYKKINQLEIYINGNHDMGIIGLKQEQIDIEDNLDFSKIDFYFQKDIARIDKLLKTNEVDNINEAEQIINFWKAAGNLDKKLLDNEKNAIFNNDELFFNNTATYKINDYTKNKLIEWKNQIMDYSNQLESIKKDKLLEFIVNNEQVKDLNLSNSLTIEGLLDKPIKDLTLYDQWVSNIDSGTFSQNGLIPKVMQVELEKQIAIKKADASLTTEHIDKLEPEVREILQKLGYSHESMGIGLKGASYDIFWQKNNGKETNLLVDKYSAHFHNMFTNAIKNHLTTIKDTLANPVLTYDDKQKAINDAYDNKRKWLKENTVILDVTKLEDIYNHPDLQVNTFITQYKNLDNGVHKQELIDLVGQEKYNELIEEQVSKIKNFVDYYNTQFEEYLATTGKTPTDLTDIEKLNFLRLKEINNPFTASQYMESKLLLGTTELNHNLKHNVFIPKNNINGTDTNYYDANYKVIESNPKLLEFHKLVESTIKQIRENLPIEIREGMHSKSIPMMNKTITDMLTDKNIPLLKKLSLSFTKMWDNIKNSFGVIKESNFSYANRDIITGKVNYDVDSSFMTSNKREINKIYKLYEANIINNVSKIYRVDKTVYIDTSKINANDAKYISDLLGIDISELVANQGQVINISKLLQQQAVHEVVKNNTTDLPKILKFYTSASAEYAARKSVQPMIDIMKEYYEKIKSPEVNNTNTVVTNKLTNEIATDGFRKKAVSQMDDWYRRNILRKFNKKHWGITNTKLYTETERKHLKEINKILNDTNNKLSDEDIKELKKIKDNLGKNFALSGFIENGIMQFQIFKNLGYNPGSAFTNLMEGVTSNVIASSNTEFFKNPESMIRAYHIAKGAVFHNFTDSAKKTSVLMRRYNVLQDNSNEMQKATIKSNFSFTKNLNPYELTRRIEYMNQSPMMNALLFETMIKSKDGTKTSNVFDAMDKEGKLLPEYATDENINNWENGKGEEFTKFNSKLISIIKENHGDYTANRGMAIKSYTFGKALINFKTWITSQIHSRFANENTDITLGKTRIGRYRTLSYGEAVSVGLLSTMSLAGVSMLIPVTVGAAIGISLIMNKKTATHENPLQETKKAFLLFGRALLKTIAVPVNFTVDKRVIKDYQAKNNTLTEQNKAATVAELSSKLIWMLMLHIFKGFVLKPEDDDDEETKERKSKWDNLITNKLMELVKSGEQYLNPVSTYKKMIGDVGLFKWIEDCVKVIDLMDEGDYQKDGNGYKKYENKAYHKFKKTFLPSIIRSPLTLGLEDLTRVQYDKTSFIDDLYNSEAEDLEQDRLQERYDLQKELHDKGATEEEIKKVLKVKFPRKGSKKERENYSESLKKLNLTEEEIQEQLDIRYKKKQSLVPANTESGVKEFDEDNTTDEYIKEYLK